MSGDHRRLDDTDVPDPAAWQSTVKGSPLRSQAPRPAVVLADNEPSGATDEVPHPTMAVDTRPTGRTDPALGRAGIMLEEDVTPPFGLPRLDLAGLHPTSIGPAPRPGPRSSFNPAWLLVALGAATLIASLLRH